MDKSKSNSVDIRTYFGGVPPVKPVKFQLPDFLFMSATTAPRNRTDELESIDDEQYHETPKMTLKPLAMEERNEIDTGPEEPGKIKRKKSALEFEAPAKGKSFQKLTSTQSPPKRLATRSDPIRLPVPFRKEIVSGGEEVAGSSSEVSEPGAEALSEEIPSSAPLCFGRPSTDPQTSPARSPRTWTSRSLSPSPPVRTSARLSTTSKWQPSGARLPSTRKRHSG